VALRHLRHDPDYLHSWWRIQRRPVAPIKVALDIDGYTQTGATPIRNTCEGDDAILRIEIDARKRLLALMAVVY
jgi:hypothetical protein